MTPDPWLERWIPTLQAASAGSPVLEIGCGSGDDTRTLTSHGLSVVAFDLSPGEVVRARLAAPKADVSVRSVLDPFPLEGTGVGAVLASLSLHYFAWQDTVAIVERVRRTLRPGGILLCRLNSTEDINYGAVGHPELEPGLFLVEGKTKRFFAEADIRRLFGRGWRFLSMEHRITHKYGLPKSLWELAVASAA